MKNFSSWVMGNESLLVQCTEILLSRGNEVRGVVTSDPEIASWAKAKELRVEPPGRELGERMGDAPFDYFLSIANLSIIPEAVLEKPRECAVNFHDGPLPRYAGLNATTWAILAGEKEHGITWHVMEGGVDEGDVLVQRIFDVQDDETALTLNARCYAQAIDSFPELLDQLEARALDRKPQDLGARTYFAKYDRPEGGGILDFGASAEELSRVVRALDYGAYPNPLAVPKIRLEGEVFLVPQIEVLETPAGAAPGTVTSVCPIGGLEVACADRRLRFPRLLDAVGRPVDLGALDLEGAVLDSPSAPEVERIGELHRELARHEELFARRLREAQPITLDGLRDASSEASWRELEVPIPEGLDGGTLRAALVAFLGRMSGKSEGDVGYSCPAIEAKVGPYEALFATTLPLHFEIGADVSLPRFAEDVGAEVKDLIERGSYPLDLISRRPELTPLDLRLAVVECDEERGRPAQGSALTLLLGKRPSSVVVAWDDTRVSAVVAEEVARRLRIVLSTLARDSDAALARISLLDDAERERLLVEWNETERDYPRDRCVHQLFEAQVERSPDAPALVFEGESLSYRELDGRINRVAHALREAGVKKDVLVGLHCKRSIDLVVGALSIQKAGGAYVPLDPAYPDDRLALMIEDSRAPIILTQTALVSSLPSHAGAKVLCVDELATAEERPTSAPEAPEVDAESLAYVIYTSGSTGRPKGVMVEHRNVVNFFAGMDERIPRDGEDQPVWLAVTSLSFDISVLELFYTLCRGYRVVIASDEDRALVSGGGATHASKAIGFSLFYFASDEGENARDKYDLLVEGSKFADAHGFEAVWTPERHFHAFGGLYPNPSVASAAIAMVTENVKIRAGSCVSPLHHPVRIAEEWALVDNLSRGRVGISFAAGWQPNDFIFRPENFADAKARMGRDIDAVRKLWRGEQMTFDGPTGKVTVKTLPRPIQEELPVWITAAGNPATFRMAGRMGAGILTHLLGQSLEDCEEKIAIYRKAWREAGHPGDGHVTLMLHTFVGDEAEEVKETVREPMKGYLRSSMKLIEQHAWAFPAFKKAASAEVSFDDNFQSLSEEDAEALLDHSFERYYETSGLFGTVDRCEAIVDRLKGIGVDEIGCLIDYGIPSTTVMEHLSHLRDLKERVAPPVPSEDREDYSIAAQIERHGVTHLQCTPSMARMLAMNEEAKVALRQVRHLMIGGEALPGSLVEELRSITDASIENMYGPTETTIWSSTATAAPTEGVVPLGRPIANTQLYVLDEHRQPLPIGVAGELYIGGDGVTRGYLFRDALTAERFVPDPFRGAPHRLYRTGDLVRYREDGTLEFLGRVDFQVKVRGYRIELGEIEAQLTSLVGVREAVVVAREDVPGDVRLAAYVTLEDGSLEEQALRAHLEAELPSYMIPSHFVVLDRLPLTPNAKVDRRALPKPDAGEAKRDAEYIQPKGETEQTIAAIWQRLLGVSKVGSKDNFFELGGHSLLAVQAHRELKEALGVELTITDLFRFPTVEGLSTHLVEGGKQASERLDRTASRAAARRDALRGRRRMSR